MYTGPMMLPKSRLTFHDSEAASNDSLDLLLSEKPLEPLERQPPRRSHRRLKISAVVFSVALNVLLSCRLAVLEFSNGTQSSELFWSFGHQISQWQGEPSPEKDELWRDLYVESFTLPKSEAQNLANKTIPVSSDPESEFVTSFSVFHYLHCLDIIRQVSEHLYFPTYYNMSETHNQFTGLEKIDGFEQHGLYSHEHIDHCFDSLRQALTCKPDLGPVVWQWNRKDQRVEVFAETVHTCANWDELLEYAHEREYLGDFVGNKQLEPAGQCGIYDTDCGFKSNE